MTDLYARAYVRLDGRRVTADELLRDAGLRARAGLAGNPAGGVVIGTADDYLLIDDAVGFVCDAVLGEGPALLRAGQPILYQMRLSRDSLAIRLEAGMAVADDGAGSYISAPVEDFAAALEAGYAEYRALFGLPG